MYQRQAIYSLPIHLDKGEKIIRNRAGLECSRPAFKPFAPTWTTLTKIHLFTISKDSVLIKQPPYYLNYPITSDGTLTKVLLYESIRVWEDVLDNSFIVFLYKKVFFFFLENDSHDRKCQQEQPKLHKHLGSPTTICEAHFNLFKENFLMTYNKCSNMTFNGCCREKKIQTKLGYQLHITCK